MLAQRIWNISLESELRRSSPAAIFCEAIQLEGKRLNTVLPQITVLPEYRKPSIDLWLLWTNPAIFLGKADGVQGMVAHCDRGDSNAGA